MRIASASVAYLVRRGWGGRASRESQEKESRPILLSPGLQVEDRQLGAREQGPLGKRGERDEAVRPLAVGEVVEESEGEAVVFAEDVVKEKVVPEVSERHQDQATTHPLCQRSRGGLAEKIRMSPPVSVLGRHAFDHPTSSH